MAHKSKFDFREHCLKLSDGSRLEIEVDCFTKQGEYCDGNYPDERSPGMDRQAELRADDERAARLFGDLFEIFVSRFLREGRFTETLVDTLLPELAARAAFRGKWVSTVYCFGSAGNGEGVPPLS